ncbi:hypothetical protein NKR23_g7692 [Pleurostoma richardsiae]|uniref:Uncharacterized protein n=1 Tax=Pleurostoma richardsiae TaxID=41990 RepID=A0AA38VDA8_9PEZI|nr:hypothetical protein NKR23_g7692 [Pleurostoma richardsiae]
MSQLHQQRRHISHPAHPETQVASSNSTVNAFMGGRQPAWMAGARPVRPTPRPDHPRQSIRPPLPPTSSATVLPSPAPSDEPSPAVSNPRDSPHSRPDSLAEQPAQNMRQPDLSQQARPVTDVRFVHEPALSADPQPASSFVHSDDAGGVIASSSHISPPGALELSAAPPPSYHALTAASHVAGGRQAPVGRPGDVQRSVPSPRLSLNLEHPFKKRRLTYSGESSSFASFTSNIDAHIQHCGGQRCLSEVERARLQILREACTKEDNFYIALHQLFAVWSLDSQEAYRYVTCSPAVVDAAFEVIGSVLKKNSLLSAPHVSFFAHFPMAIEPLLQFSGQYAATFESALSLFGR